LWIRSHCQFKVSERNRKYSRVRDLLFEQFGIIFLIKSLGLLRLLPGRLLGRHFFPAVDIREDHEVTRELKRPRESASVAKIVEHDGAVPAEAKVDAAWAGARNGRESVR
jgi:hypothetical protein